MAYGRSPYGERGLKYHRPVVDRDGRRRSPYGERGLKSVVRVDYHRCLGSLSLRRAWIEIPSFTCTSRGVIVALLTESVD